MRKSNTVKRREVCHVPNSTHKEIRMFGDGDFQKGLKKIHELVFNLNRTNYVKDNGFEKIKLQTVMQQMNNCMDLIKLLFPHRYNLVGAVPGFVVNCLVNNKLDFDILKHGRKEKTLDELDKSKVRGV